MGAVDSPERNSKFYQIKDHNLKTLTGKSVPKPLPIIVQLLQRCCNKHFFNKKIYITNDTQKPQNLKKMLGKSPTSNT